MKKACLIKEINLNVGLDVQLNASLDDCKCKLKLQLMLKNAEEHLKLHLKQFKWRFEITFKQYEF